MILKKAGFEWTILQRLAELSERVGDIKGCITSLEELALSDPDNLNLQLLIIEMYERDGNNEQVAKKLDELSAFYPDNLSVLETKAKLMIKQDKLEEAARYYLRAFQNADVALLDKIRIAQMFLYAGVKDSTVLPYVYEMLIDTDKDTSDWEVKLYLGAAAMGLRNDSVAIAYLHQAVELAPYNSEGWLRLGGLYFDNGKYKEAVTVLTQAFI
jgi:tetratricopeptide (TPR) repeat protein